MTTSIDNVTTQPARTSPAEADISFDEYARELK
jgi:hypothetical protein